MCRTANETVSEGLYSHNSNYKTTEIVHTYPLSLMIQCVFKSIEKWSTGPVTISIVCVCNFM